MTEQDKWQLRPLIRQLGAVLEQLAAVMRELTELTQPCTHQRRKPWRDKQKCIDCGLTVSREA